MELFNSVYILLSLQDSYSMFGVQFHADDQIIRPLESQHGLRRLYPQNYDHKRELKKLNHSILANFLDLLDILIRCPDNRKSGDDLNIRKRGEKIDDLTLLFIHMHHLINEFRPHQARETLRVLMEIQQRQRLETAERFQNHLDKVQQMLEKSIEALPEDTELDSKLAIKLEPMDTEAQHPILNTLKQESDSGINGEDDLNGCSTLDRMMCHIVDNMT